ncbi:MAG: response regulator [Planctomycetota bacterium]
MRVLVVDDSEMVRDVLVAMIRRVGHEALPASTGAEALAAEGYDAVVIDHELPDRNGLDVARELRTRDAALPIYAVSGHPDAVERSRDAGLDGCLTKPFKLQDVETLLGVATAHREFGSGDLVQVMLYGVIDEVPRLLDQAEATTDPKEMRRLAHTIAGALRFLEDSRIHEDALALERAAQNHDIDAAVLARLRGSFDALLPRLRELLG